MPVLKYQAKLSTPVIKRLIASEADILEMVIRGEASDHGSSGKTRSWDLKPAGIWQKHCKHALSFHIQCLYFLSRDCPLP
eukprot:1139184-Pelagomonas_calceolata.AAC.10